MKLFGQLGSLLRTPLIGLIVTLQRLNAGQQQRIAQQEEVIAQLRTSNETLQKTVLELQAQVQQQQTKMEELLRHSHRQAAPFSKGKPPSKPKPPGRRKGRGRFSRRKPPSPEEVSRTLEAPLCSCPDCGAELRECQSHEQFEVDLPVPRPVITRFVTHSGYCAACHKRVRSRHPEQTSNAVGAAGVSIGPQVRALAADLKHRLGMPYAKIAELLRTAFGLDLTPSALCQSDARLALAALPIYNQLCKALQECQAVHADETGWRIGVLSAWLWVFTSKHVTVYVIDKSRSSEVILRILGKEFQGTLHSDCFVAYDHQALEQWLKQKCLAHLLKDLSRMQEEKQGAAILFPQLVAQVLRRAFALRDEKPTLTAEVFEQRQQKIEKSLDALIDKRWTWNDPDNERMAKRLRKQRKHLLTFLQEPDSEPTNNRAERALRPAVISRKTGACNKTAAGAQTHAVISSIAVTARQQGHNPIQRLAEIITAPTGSSTLLSSPSGCPP